MTRDAEKIRRNVTARRNLITWWWDLSPQARRWARRHPRRTMNHYRAWMAPFPN